MDAGSMDELMRQTIETDLGHDHEPQDWQALLQAFSRSTIIRSVAAFPKLKAAAMFQPEDTIKGKQNVKALQAKRREAFSLGGRIGKVGWKGLHHGTIFGAGILMFAGHEVVLHRY